MKSDVGLRRDELPATKEKWTKKIKDHLRRVIIDCEGVQEEECRGELYFVAKYLYLETR